MKKFCVQRTQLQVHDADTKRILGTSSFDLNLLDRMQA